MAQSALPAALLLISLAACGGDDPLSVGENLRLSEARGRWQERSFLDYTFQVRSVCFCPEEYSLWMEVEVRNGVVVAVREPGESGSLPAHRLAEWPTIDALFDRIATSARADGVEDVRARFDDELGFPTEIVIDADEETLDGGALIEVRSLAPLP